MENVSIIELKKLLPLIGWKKNKAKKSMYAWKSNLQVFEHPSESKYKYYIKTKEFKVGKEIIFKASTQAMKNCKYDEANRLLYFYGKIAIKI